MARRRTSGLGDVQDQMDDVIPSSKTKEEIAPKPNLDEIHAIMTVRINRVIHAYKRPSNQADNARFDYILSAFNLESKKNISMILNNVPEIDKQAEYKVTVESVQEFQGNPQYVVGSVTPIIRPNDGDGLERWLAKFCDGIGNNIAKAIIQRLGANAYAAMENPLVLQQLEFLSEKLISEITTKWTTDKQKNELFAFLIKFRNVDDNKAVFNKRQIESLITKFGPSVKEVIKMNPWSLIKVIPNLGFKTADSLAKASNADMSSPDRINAAISYAMQKIEKDDGHCYGKLEEIVRQIKKMTDIDSSVVEAHIQKLSDESKKDLENADNDWLVIEGDNIFRSEIYKAEVEIVEKIVRMLKRGPRCDRHFAETLVTKVAQKEGLVLDESQQNAAVTSLMYPIVVMTGGPGVGKSTIQKIIMNCLLEMNQTFSASCPTGKGARRQEDASGFPASTVHRQLEYSPEDEGFRRNAKNPIDAHAIIVDESSMADILIAHKQITAIRDDAQIIYVGDINQIPSVGAGQFLKDMIMSGLIPVCELSKTHRQANESGIPIVAKRILEGDFPIEDNEVLRGVTVRILNNEDDLTDEIAKFIKYEIPRMGLSPDRDVMVLAPTKKENDGVRDSVASLNTVIKHSINHPESKDTRVYGSMTLSVRDVVMQIQNDKDLKVNNGEAGIVIGFQKVINEQKDHKGIERRTVKDFPIVDFDGRRVVYNDNAMANLVPANANTYHKAQGSEQVCAIIACPNDPTSKRMNTRNLLYTGFTRGKGESVIMGTREAIWSAVRNLGIERQTGLASRLKNEINGIKNYWDKNNWPTTFLDKNAEIIAFRLSEQERIKNKVSATLSAMANKRKIRPPRLIKQHSVSPQYSHTSAEPIPVDAPVHIKEEQIPMEKKIEQEKVIENEKIASLPIAEKHTITASTEQQEKPKENMSKKPIRRPVRQPRFILG